MSTSAHRGVGFWFGRCAVAAALLIPMKFALLLAMVGVEDYLSRTLPDGILLVLGIEFFLYFVPTVLILMVLAAIGWGTGTGIIFGVLCVMLLAPVAVLAVLLTPGVVYLVIETVGQLVVAAVAIRYADALRPQSPTAEQAR